MTYNVTGKVSELGKFAEFAYNSASEICSYKLYSGSIFEAQKIEARS